MNSMAHGSHTDTDTGTDVRRLELELGHVQQCIHSDNDNEIPIAICESTLNTLHCGWGGGACTCMMYEVHVHVHVCKCTCCCVAKLHASCEWPPL